MKYQVTIYNAENKYRPISTIIDLNTDDKKTIINEGVKKICVKRFWTGADLKKWGYTQAKYRKYTEE